MESGETGDDWSEEMHSPASNGLHEHVEKKRLILLVSVDLVQQSVGLILANVSGDFCK